MDYTDQEIEMLIQWFRERWHNGRHDHDGDAIRRCILNALVLPTGDIEILCAARLIREAREQGVKEMVDRMIALGLAPSCGACAEALFTGGVWSEHKHDEAIPLTKVPDARS